jgi:hypothetical protein
MARRVLFLVLLFAAAAAEGCRWPRAHLEVHVRDEAELAAFLAEGHHHFTAVPVALRCAVPPDTSLALVVHGALVVPPPPRRRSLAATPLPVGPLRGELPPAHVVLVLGERGASRALALLTELSLRSEIPHFYVSAQADDARSRGFRNVLAVSDVRTHRLVVGRGNAALCIRDFTPEVYAECTALLLSESSESSSSSTGGS